MGLDDIRLRETIDLRERVHQLREEFLPELDRRIEAAEAVLADEDTDEGPEDDPRRLRNLREKLAGQAKAFERVIQALCPEHGDAPDTCPGVDCEHAESAFTIRELMTAETSMLTDDLNEQAFQIDAENERASVVPKEGYHRRRTLELALTEAPAEMPMAHDPAIGHHYEVGKLPDHVSDYLYQCVLALNDAGEVEGVGNLSAYGVTPAETSSV